MKHENDKILTTEEVLNEYDKIPEEREYTPEELEVIAEFEEFEKNEIEIMRQNQIPIPEKKRAISQLFLHDFQVTLSPNLKELELINRSQYKKGNKEFTAKHPLSLNWQNNRYDKNDLNDFYNECDLQFYDKFYGVLTGAVDCNNVTVLDFDVKSLTEDIRVLVLSYISQYIQTDLIQSLIKAKKIYIETTLSKGYHFIVSIDDLEERKSKKLLQYGHFEAILELVGKNHHTVCYPTNGYKKQYNLLWEIEKITTKEYNELLDFTLDYFQKLDYNIHTEIKSKDKVNNPDKPKSSKTNLDTSTLDKDETELKNYQSKFCESKKDIEILKKLLQDNGYTEISQDNNYILYTHSNSTKSDANFSVDINNHCIRSFSSNNIDFDVDTNYGSLRACYILYRGINKDKGLKDFYEYLKQKFDITLKLSTNDINDIMQNTKRYFFVHEDGIKELAEEFEKIDIQKRSKEYIYTLLDLRKNEDKYTCFENLVKNCTLPKSVKIKYVYGAPRGLQGTFEYKNKQVIYYVRFAKSKKPIKNNELVTQYFNEILGDKIAVEFWENWLAAYCYYNYWCFENHINVKHSLPVCIFKSPLRGVGKSDLANLAISIFPNHAAAIKAEDLIDNFNAELDKKLLAISEAQKLGLKQLGIIKFVGGEQWILINNKYIAKYFVENNLSLIFSSNNEVPLFTNFVEKDQLTENHNQFFVWEFSKNPKFVENEELYFDMFEDVQNAFPYYVETYLRDVWETRVLPNMKGKRYIIPVPITPYELHMFDSNKTIDDHILEDVVFTLMMDKGKYINKEMLSDLSSNHKKDADFIVNLLVEKKLIDPVKKPRNGKRVYVVNEKTLNSLIKLYGFDMQNLKKGIFDLAV